MSVQEESTLLFVGYARLPGNIVSVSGNGTLIFEIEVDPNTDLIVDVAISHLPSLGVKLILEILIGYDLKQTLSCAEDEIRRRFFGPTRKATIVALENAYEGYLRCKNSKLKENKSGK